MRHAFMWKISCTLLQWLPKASNQIAKYAWRFGLAWLLWQLDTNICSCLQLYLLSPKKKWKGRGICAPTKQAVGLLTNAEETRSGTKTMASVRISGMSKYVQSCAFFLWMHPFWCLQVLSAWVLHKYSLFSCGYAPFTVFFSTLKVSLFLQSLIQMLRVWSHQILGWCSS